MDNLDPDNLDEQDDNGLSLLMQVCINGIYEHALKLIRYGADLEIKDTHGNTALSFASRHNKINIVKLLIENGANTETKDSEGITPLMYAALNDNIEIIEMLLKAEVNVNEKDIYNDTALTYAAQAGQFNCVKLLLDHGADKTIKNNDGNTAKSLSYKRRHKAVYALLK